MSDPTIGPNIPEPFHIRCALAAKLSFHAILLLNDRAELLRLGFRQILCVLPRIDRCIMENAQGKISSDPVDRRQRNRDPFLIRERDASDTSHTKWETLSLSLLMFRLDANNPETLVPPNEPTIFAAGFDGCLDFHTSSAVFSSDK